MKTQILNDGLSLKQAALADFLNFGVAECAYIRPVTVQGQLFFAIHSANGNPLAVVDTLDSAQVSIRHNDMTPHALH